MKEPRIYVDFNEMIEDDLVLLSKTDIKLDSAGKRIELLAGAKVKYTWMILMTKESKII